MQSPFNDKLAYNYPCKSSQTCIDYEGYDPCESSEDITEKDLVVLLKEEAAKLEREKEKAQAMEGEIKTTSPSSVVDDKSKLLSLMDDKPKQLPQIDDADFKEEEEESGVKKKNCKYIKNPFFTNRLKLSTSHLPLPPPGPPPQNFPLAEDESSTKICPKKKKKCKKEDDKTKKPSYKTVYNGEIIVKDDTKEENEEDEKDEEESTKVCPSANAIENGNASARTIIERANEDKSKDSKKKDTRKKSCKKRTDDMLPTCKKKESEVSINFGPRKIPLQQKDLPQTSPKDIPEVEHQILMACGKNQQIDCKKKCKKKDNIK